jgi:hypothetical protein
MKRIRTYEVRRRETETERDGDRKRWRQKEMEMERDGDGKRRKENHRKRQHNQFGLCIARHNKINRDRIIEDRTYIMRLC